MNLNMARSRAVLCILMSLAIGCTPLGKSNLRSQLLDRKNAQMYGIESPINANTNTEVSAKPNNLPLTPTSLSAWTEAPLLSPGDRLLITVQDGDEFNGRYEIDIGGALMLPYLPKLIVAGTGVRNAEKLIRDALVSAEWFRPDQVAISVRVHEWAHIQVHVRGAVFSPGIVTINARNAELRALKDNLIAGDYPSERLLSSALRAAGGIRPDACLDTIQVIRKDRILSVNYGGLMNGEIVPTVTLMDGDQVLVSQSGRFDQTLITTSIITPPGIRVFLSNLSVPAMNNASSAIGKHATGLPYGSRLLTAALSANCVGGAEASNASRYTVLLRHNPITGQQEVIERSLKDLLNQPAHNLVNPYLMPNDGVACYDSGVTNLREIARTISDFLLPLSLF